MKSNYKRYKGWCDNCDANIVESGKKCSRCSKRNHTNKVKKPNKNEILKGL